MKTNWMPITGGVLTIIVGILEILAALAFALIFIIADPLPSYNEKPIINLFIIGLPLLIAGMISITGGLFSVIRRLWRCSIAFSIVAGASFVIFSFVFFLYILQINTYGISWLLVIVLLIMVGSSPTVFVVLSKSQFK
jgi:hypothetical protein